ncbi:MAG: hypothetical protein ACRDV7_03155, partial [Acidimicrobiia bacterium]
MKCAVRFGICASLVLLATLSSGEPAAAQQGESCVAAVDGQPTTDYRNPSHSLDLDVDSVHLVEATAPPDATDVRVEVETLIGERVVVDVPVVPGSVFAQPVQLDEDVAPYGVGLYRVHVTTGSCEQTLWVRLTGRHPLTTVSGAVGSVALLGGVGLLGLGVVRAVRRRRGYLLGGVGGALGGV